MFKAKINCQDFVWVTAFSLYIRPLFSYVKFLLKWATVRGNSSILCPFLNDKNKYLICKFREINLKVKESGGIWEPLALLSTILVNVGPKNSGLESRSHCVSRRVFWEWPKQVIQGCRRYWYCQLEMSLVSDRNNNIKNWQFSFNRGLQFSNASFHSSHLIRSKSLSWARQLCYGPCFLVFI